METYEQITLDQWVQWKEDIRQKLAETAGNFVHIGYRLKQIRDSGIFDGAADIFGFAEREYGLGKSTVSRFIAINERYSEGGNSLELKEEFRAFSSSKLSEMLTLPDNEIQLITEKTTIREIRELKEFNRQEVRQEAGEAIGEAAEQEACQDRGSGDSLAPFEKCLIDFFKDKEGMLNRIMGLLGEDSPEYRKAMEQMNPSGQSSHKKGIVFLFLYDWTTGIKYKLLTQPEPVSLSWPEFLDNVFSIYCNCDRENVWKDFYKSAATESSVATSQQEESEPEIPEKDPKENSGQAVMEDVPSVAGEEPENMEEPVAAAIEEPQAAAVEGTEASVPEEQIPGQMEVKDYPELIPEGMKEEDHGTGRKEAADGGSSAKTGGAPGTGSDSGGQELDDPKDHSEGSGTAEDDGCAEDPENTVMTEESAWEDVRNAKIVLDLYFRAQTGLEKYTEIDTIQAMYEESINLAAALEKLMMIRGRKPFTSDKEKGD